MRHLLRLTFVLFFLAIAWATWHASLDRPVLDALREFWPDAWFRATLTDTYLAFLTIYLWVFYKETSWLSRLLWLIAILLLGNFAIAFYGFKEALKLKESDSISRFFLKDLEK